MDPDFDLAQAGKAIYSWCEDLFPICRSITGEGVRETLRYFQAHIPELEIRSVPSGTKVFDWTIPLEWNIRDAYIETLGGKRILSFSDSNLHVVGYSTPVDKIVGYDELVEHLYALPELPDAIPYVTSYYKERWGFCLEYSKIAALDKSASYRVVIDSSHEKGFLDYGELFIPSTSKGGSGKDIFLSSYVCHPSMANNELSGPCVLLAIAKWLRSLDNRRYNYRIVFVPETIGALAFLSLQDLELMRSRVVGGYNLTCLGDDRCFSLLESRKGGSKSDIAAKYVAKQLDSNYKIYHWKNRGSDERQYCSPNVDLPIATLMRSKFGTYPEYHTSLDRLGSVVTETGLEGGFLFVQQCLSILEKDITLKSDIIGEPQLGKRDLYPTLSLKQDGLAPNNIILDVMSMADGKTSLLEIAEFFDIPFWDIQKAAEVILSNDLGYIC